MSEQQAWILIAIAATKVVVDVFDSMLFHFRSND
jgi:hypothetical protein